MFIVGKSSRMCPCVLSSGRMEHPQGRIEKDRLLCHVNGQLVVELADPDFYGNIVGLGEISQTVAEFKQFQVGKTVDPVVAARSCARHLRKRWPQLSRWQATRREGIWPVAQHPVAGAALLRRSGSRT